MDLTITQNFLAELLFDTDKHAILNPPYQDKQAYTNTSMFLLSAAFNQMMEEILNNPAYGVKGMLDENVRSTLAEQQYQEQPPQALDVYRALGRSAEEALNDPAARSMIVYIIQAFAAMKEMREEKDQATDRDGRDQS